MSGNPKVFINLFWLGRTKLLKCLAVGREQLKSLLSSFSLPAVFFCWVSCGLFHVCAVQGLARYLKGIYIKLFEAPSVTHCFPRFLPSISSCCGNPELHPQVLQAKKIVFFAHVLTILYHRVCGGRSGHSGSSPVGEAVWKWILLTVSSFKGQIPHSFCLLFSTLQCFQIVFSFFLNLRCPWIILSEHSLCFENFHSMLYSCSSLCAWFFSF